MDSTTMKKAQHLEAVKKYKKAEFVYNLMVYSLTAFLSCLFYFYLFWFPTAASISNIKHFFLVLAPDDSFFFSPRLLFLIIGNVIVLFLVGESKRGGSKHSSPANEIYDEYVRRTSRSLDLAERHHFDMKHGCFDMGHDSQVVKCDKGSQMQEKPLTSTTMEHKKKKDRKTLEVGRNITRKSITSRKMDDHGNRIMNDARHAIHAKLPEKKSLVLQEADNVGANVVSVTSTREKMCHVGAERDDDLKRRAEDFIARVNRQRMLEE